MFQLSDNYLFNKASQKVATNRYHHVLFEIFRVLKYLLVNLLLWLLLRGFLQALKVTFGTVPHIRQRPLHYSLTIPSIDAL
jgi:hypothetical protein